MENQLETIKANLPYGYEKQIAKEVGCSQGTVHNILNNKPASARSTYKEWPMNLWKLPKESLGRQPNWKLCIMELQADSALTKRENQIAGLAACGLAKKEIADRLGTAYGTVNVLLDKAYKKTGTSKLNELGAWWINRVFALNIDFKQLQKSLIALSFLGIIAFQIAFDCNNDLNRSRRARIRRNRIEEVYEL